MVHSALFLGPALIAVLLATGVATGLLSGLLGIGGGVVAVPVLLEVFASAGLSPPLATPLAIGTAHAAVLLASIAAAVAHARAGRVDRALLRRWLPPMLVGAMLGLAMAWVAAPAMLVGLFALVTVSLGAVMLAGERAALTAQPPGPPLAAVPPALVGLLAAALGLGGGTLSGPALLLMSVPLRAAIGAGSVFNLAVAGPALLVFLAAGWNVQDLPPLSLGYVSLVPLALLVVPALIVAPAAARLAARLPIPLLRRLFAFCLLGISARLLFGMLR